MPRKHLGSKHPPLVQTEPKNIILYELHLLLSVADILLRNIILQVDSLDRRSRMTTNPKQHPHPGNADLQVWSTILHQAGTEPSHHKCTLYINSMYMYLYNCVCHTDTRLQHIYIISVPHTQDENDKPVTGVFTWPALSKKDKLTVMRELSPMLDPILPESDAIQIGRLWEG